MRKHPHWRALALSVLLSIPFVQAALADEPQQQALTRMASSAEAVGLFGPYDVPAPTAGN